TEKSKASKPAGRSPNQKQNPKSIHATWDASFCVELVNKAELECQKRGRELTRGLSWGAFRKRGHAAVLVMCVVA
ncbi:MAG: hypothetical protein ACHP79_08240, partial [Terriglobales bacterium]